MYDLPCNDALNEWKVSLESLAMIYVTADKYQVKSLTENVYHKIRRHVNCQNVTRVEGFLDALEVIITGTTTGNKCVRTTMINACVKDINKLQKSCGFHSSAERARGHRRRDPSTQSPASYVRRNLVLWR